MIDLSGLEKLYEAAVAGRPVTEEQIAEIVEYVASVGFSNLMLRAGGRLAGIVWNGVALQGRDLIPIGEGHYLRHCVRVEEWPHGTTYANYVASIREVIQHPNTGILCSRLYGEPQITFVRESGLFKGPDGQRWMLIDYRLTIDGWVTAFQPVDGLRELISADRSNKRWLRLPSRLKT